MMQIKTAIEMIQTALNNLPTGSEVHRDALQAVNRLSRHMPQGSPTAGVQQTMLKDLLSQTVRNAVLQRVMAQRGAGDGGGAAGSPGGGATAPPPSTPLPGA